MEKLSEITGIFERIQARTKALEASGTQTLTPESSNVLPTVEERRDGHSQRSDLSQPLASQASNKRAFSEMSVLPFRDDSLCPADSVSNASQSQQELENECPRKRSRTSAALSESQAISNTNASTQHVTRSPSSDSTRKSGQESDGPVIKGSFLNEDGTVEMIKSHMLPPAVLTAVNGVLADLASAPYSLQDIQSSEQCFRQACLGRNETHRHPKDGALASCQTCSNTGLPCFKLIELAPLELRVVTLPRGLRDGLTKTDFASWIRIEQKRTKNKFWRKEIIR